MIRRILALLLLCASAPAATRYVSSTGTDSGAGGSGAPWKTLAYAMAHVAASDSVLLERGDVWGEPLVISQNGLTIDAYGSGPAPRITGYQALTTWTNQGSNIWSAPMANGNCSAAFGSVLFNGILGQRKSAASGASGPAADRDYYCDGYSPSHVFVYATASPATYYQTVAALSSYDGTSLISIAGKSNVTIQHLQLDYFEEDGVYVSGGSTNLNFANMSANGMAVSGYPSAIAGARPYGFQVLNGTSTTVIHFINVDAHLNYDGFRIDSYGAGSSISLTGCRAFANRDLGINDNSGGAAVTYGYSHLYANGITGIDSTDVSSNVTAVLDEHGHNTNVAQNTPPVVQGLNRFPALFSFTIDDVGLSPGTEAYIDTLLPVVNARGLKMNMAATAGYNPIASEMAAWVAAGHEVDSHSWSHQYYTSTGGNGGLAVFNIQYTGSAATGSAATMTIAGGTLSTSVTGGPGSFSISLASYPTLPDVIDYITATFPNTYTISAQTTRSDSPIHTATLADVSAVNIKSSAYTANFDLTRFWTDEITTSRAWLVNAVPALSILPMVYVYPGGWNTTQSNGIAATAGYVGGRGQIGMHPSGHTTVSPLYATDLVAAGRGTDLYNILSLTPSTWHGSSQAQIDRKVGALVFKAQAWGLPFGLFAHNVDAPALTPQDVGWILDSIRAHHGQVKKNSELVSYLQTGTLVPTTTQYLAPPTGPLPSLRTAASSPDRLAEASASVSAYPYDILGNQRTGDSWDIGAYPSALWGAQQGAAGTAKWTNFGKYKGPGTGENAYCLPGDIATFGSTDGPATLPQQCTYTAMSGTPSPGAVRTASSCSNIATQLAAVANNSGDTVEIPASLGTCVGTWAPTYQGDAAHWLTIRTDQIAAVGFPAEGVRATPCLIGITHIDDYPDYFCPFPFPSLLMPTLSSNVANKSALDLTQCNYCRLIGIDITKESSVNIANSLVGMTGSDHTILDRVLIHDGDWSTYDYQHTAKAGVSPRGTYQAVINSWIYDIAYPNADGQCLVGGIGSQADEGPLKVYNNLLACSSETWLFGGGAAYAWPHDLEFRRNLSMKPLKWMAPIGATTFSGPNSMWPNVKNLGEFKHGHRILYEENIFMNSWEGQSDQTGNVILTMPKNQTRQNNVKYVNTSVDAGGKYTNVACAKDAAGTPCDAHTGAWGNRITSLARTNGVVTLIGQTDGGWPYQEPGSHAVLQSIPSQLVNLTGGGTLNLNTFNGDVELGCLPDRSLCTDGFGVPGIAYFASAGADFPQTTLSTTPTQPLYQDYTAATCAVPGHCAFAAPQATYLSNPIVSVIDSEHITVTQDLGPQTGATQSSCHPGAAPKAQVQDFTVRYNYLQHAENLGFSMSNAISGCQDLTQGVSNISYHDNVHDDIDTTAWTRTASCCGHGGGGISLGNSAPDVTKEARNVEIAHNTFASQRGWPGSYHASGSFGFSDGYNYSYTGLTLQRVSNLVTITYAGIAGDASPSKIVVAGFTGSYTDLNGTWDVYQYLGTQLSFVESGSHADIGLVSISAGTTGTATLTPPLSYYANVTFRDNIGPGPVFYAKWNSVNDSRGLSAMLDLNMKDPATGISTWKYKNNLLGTALYAGYAQAATANIPTTNPDSASTCTLSSGCSVTDFSGVFTNWGFGLGDTSANDYTVTATYKNSASDGKDMGADSNHWKALKAALMPHFTFAPLTANPQTMTCSLNTYCEQQLTWAGGASPFVQVHLTNGTLPTGMSLANGDGVNSCKVNGSYSKTGPTGCAGWIWGTPTTVGSTNLTFTVEDAAHQKATVNLTLTVNSVVGAGPPTFSGSRTDLAVTQPDATPQPNLGGLTGANTVAADSLYNNIEIVRCTDSATNPANLNTNFVVGVGGSGDKNSWSLDDALVQLGDYIGNNYMFRFDPATKVCRPVCSNGSTDAHCSGSTLYTLRRVQQNESVERRGIPP